MSYKYDDLDDDNIILLVHDKDNEAMDYLLEKYRPVVKRISRTMYIMGADSEDLVQEGMIGLFKAIRDYNIEKSASFYGFAKMCIERQVYSAVTASNRKKHSPLNSYVSIYIDVEDKEDGARMFGELLEAGNDSNPETRFIGKEELLTMQEAIDTRLSDFEKKVMELYLEGLAYSDIASQLDKSVKSIDNAVQRIRSKLSV